jgi:hypothetical protein
VSRRELALRRFLKLSDLTVEDVRNAPPLPLPTPRKHVIDAMRFSAEPSVIAFLKVYDEIPSFDRTRVPVEAVALHARVNFNELLGAIVMCFRNVQAQKSAMLAMARHPGLLAKTIKYAGEREGIGDRRIVHQAVGFLPSPKGASINFNFGQETPEPSEAAADEAPPDVNDLFPMITAKQEKWQESRQKLLQATK